MLINTPEPTGYMLRKAWWSYHLANWLYYHASGDAESPMTDAEWDSNVEFLNRWRHMLPNHLQDLAPEGDYKTVAHGIPHTQEDVALAMEWETAGGRVVPAHLLPNNWSHSPEPQLVDHLDD